MKTKKHQAPTAPTTPQHEQKRSNQHLAGYTQEFREKVLADWFSGTRSFATVAREHGVNLETLRLWRKKYGPDVAQRLGLPAQKEQVAGPQTTVSAQSSILSRLAALEAAVASLKKAVGA